MENINLDQSTLQPFRLTPQTAFFRSLVENAPDLILVLDRLARIRYASPAVEAVIGYRPDEVLYQSLKRYLDSGDVKPFEQAFLQAQTARRGAAAGAPPATLAASLQLRLVSKDGQRRTLDCSLLDRFADPLVGGLILHGRDVTRYAEAESALRKDHARLRRYLEEVGSIVLALDADGKIQWANASAGERLGYPSSLLIGMNWFDHFSPAVSRQEAVEQFQRLLQGDQQDWLQDESPVLVASGEERRVAWRISRVVDEQGRALGVLYVGEDVTELRRLQEALDAAQTRYSLALAGANDGIWDWNLETNEFYASPRWKEMLGYAEAELQDHPQLFWQFIHPEDLEAFKAAVDAHLKGNTPRLEMELRLMHKSGQTRWGLVRGLAARSPSGAAWRLAGSLTDITARKEAEQNLVYDALHDTLTGLPNRLLFFDRLERAIKRYKRNPGFPYAVLYVDVDHLQQISQEVGSGAETLLKAISQRLLANLRSMDTLTRLSGDEFAILVEELLALEDARLVANRILETCRQPFWVEGKSCSIQLSIGVAPAAPEYLAPQEALRDAEIAMYRAKALGRGRAVVFTPEMRAEAMTRLEIEDDLRQALRLNQLELHYQPILDLVSMAVVSFEALLRWRNPRRGLLSAADFLSIAEEAGLLLDLDRWALSEACRQIKRWRDLFPFNPTLKVSVNLSGQSFRQEDLPLQVEEALVAADLEPSALQLELEETALLDPSGQVRRNLEKIRRLGVRLHLDHFGVGYSSLHSISALPLDMIKIDRSFIQRIGAGQTEVVLAILRLARELNVQTIAEGIETSVQYERLRTFGCPYGQGNFLSAPQSKEEIEQFLTKLAKPLRAASVL